MTHGRNFQFNACLAYYIFLEQLWEQERMLPVCYTLFQKEPSDGRGQLFLFSSRMICIWNDWSGKKYKQKKKSTLQATVNKEVGSFSAFFSLTYFYLQVYIASI